MLIKILIGLVVVLFLIVVLLVAAFHALAKSTVDTIHHIARNR